MGQSVSVSQCMNRLLTGVLLLGLGCFSAANAEIYRSVDKQGNVTFTDQPQEDAEPVKVDPVNIQPPFTQKSNRAVTASPDPASSGAYKSLEIVSPENESTFRNIESLALTAKLVPVLQSDHMIQFTDNGAALGEPTRSMSTSIAFPDRGTHQYQANVIDKKGNIVFQGLSITVYIHRTSVIKPRPPAGNPN